MKTRLLRPIVFALAAAALLGGCDIGGGDDETASTGATDTGGTAGDGIVQGVHVLGVVEVHETEYRLEPASFRFERVGYFGIKAVNDGKEPHALTVRGPGVAVQTPTIEPGSSATIAVFFQKPGTYRMYCPLGNHSAQGMRGTITVV